MEKTRHYFLKCLALFFLIAASQIGGAQEDSRFQLLPEVQSGVMFFRNPCQPEAFTLIFSFSKDLKGEIEEEILFISFSQEFEDFLKTQHERMKSVALFAGVPQKIGNRQLRVDYIAKRVRLDGSLDNFELPDQIEIVILNNDLAKVLDQSNRSCEGVPSDERERTLLLSNPSEKCGAYLR